MMIIFKSQQYWVQWYAFKQVTSGHDISSSFVWKIEHEIIRKFGVIRIQDHASAHNKFYIILSAILGRLLKCYLIHYRGGPWHLTNDHCRRHDGNDWHSEWRMPRTQWTHNRPSVKYFVTKYGFKRIHIWLSMDAGAFETTIDGM